MIHGPGADVVEPQRAAADRREQRDRADDRPRAAVRDVVLVGRRVRGVCVGHVL